MKDGNMARTGGSGLGRTSASAVAVTALAIAGCAAGMVSTAPAAVARIPAAAATAAATARTAGTAKTVTTAAAVATRATAAAAYSPPRRNLSLGMSGSDVKALQRRLSALKYYPGAINGRFGTDTQAAVWAFQEINGISDTGTVGPATKRALVHPRTYRSPYYRGKRATRVEVDQSLEVLVVYKDNRILLISHVSSGGGYYYDCGSGGCARAVTPNGTYNTTAYIHGWVTVPLGRMYNSVFFIGRLYAIHGDTYVPKGPASHGCVRVPMDVANFFHTLVKTPGTQVRVYGSPQ